MSWWQDGVIYHVHPRSFADADGDGDRRGLAGRPDHLREPGLALRREFVREPYETLAVDDATPVFRRGAFVVALNLSGERAERPPGELRLSTELDGGADVLRPDEGVLLSR